MLIECVLLSATLCHAVRDRPVMIVATIQSAALIADGITTMHEQSKTATNTILLADGQRLMTTTTYYEGDPISRVFIGRYPTWSRMAPAGTVLVVGQMYLAERMRRSSHRWIRDLWWLPQAVTISANIAGIVRNTR